MKITIFLIFAFLFLTFCTSTESVNLKLNLEQGKTYRLAQNTEQQIKQTIDTLEQNIKTSMTGILSFYIKEKLKTGFVADVKFEKLKFDIDAPHMKMSFDSENPSNPKNIISGMYTSFLNKIFTITFKNNGQIISIDGIKTIVDDILKNLQIKDEIIKAQLKENFNQMMGEKALKANFESITYIFPDKTVSVKQSWHNSLTLENAVPSKLYNKWTLLSIESDIIKISGESKISSVVTEAWAKINDLKTKYKIRGKQTAKIHVNAKTGWIVSAMTRSKIAGKIIVDQNPQVPEGIEIPIEIETTNKYKSL